MTTNDRGQDDKQEEASAANGGEALDDIVIESYDDESPGIALPPEERIKRLKDDLRACKEERQSYLDGWQRAKADLANWKRREEDERKQFLKFAAEGLIADLLPVLDGFHMAAANKEAWEKVDPAWRQGVEYLHKELLRVLAGQGLEEFSPLGAPFDPKEHTAIGAIPTDDPGKDHFVAEVIQRGYRLREKVLRPAQVKIYELGGGARTKT